MEPIVLPGVVELSADQTRPGLVVCTFLGGPALSVVIPRAKVQEIFDWWLTIAPELAVDGYLEEATLEQFRNDIIAAAVPDDLS
ncbi:hypothetical protein LWF15_12775 [Kineosporia rhizophila]|uniref:hypothetical protein n=1 Tax=Kineosporia TaxID=49184 RepID=UPI001E5D2C49|nr:MULTISPECIES: hypothetical protein [Kineosporia]MCE0536385.1 hypothetical protein [Kineosporia rhizophila]GLY15523.1 hypothetical protein Kisp01_25380 [Kineosporia sp. NBRC 101677]